MSSMPTSERLAFNGLDGASGNYLLPPMTPAQVSAMALGESFNEQEIVELRQRAFDLNNPNAGVEADARDLAETGWGVLFASDSDPAVREALRPLLERRKEQAGDLYQEFSGSRGYRPRETKDDFLTRHGMGPGPVNPAKVPYYLLIVGDPGTIPFRFQYQMDVQYAVGRIYFRTAQEYSQYAQSVVTAESNPTLPPLATFFGTANPDDRATQMSSEFLIAPLAQKVREDQEKRLADRKKPQPKTENDDLPPVWQIQTLVKEQAGRQQLSDLLNGQNAPAFLFTASHGIGFPNGHPRQLPHQGALVCQDWPGPLAWRSAVPEEHTFAADHLSSDANLLGMLAFFFACYGAGTPEQDEFASQIWSGQPDRRAIAPHNFLAELPTRMLGLPKGGALAVVGHIERAWGNSFFWGQAGPQIQVFNDCLSRLIKGGYPVGYAMEVFNNRYAELSADLTSELQEIHNHGKHPNDLKLSGMWTARNDARNYIILGDPAVRLGVTGKADQHAARPVVISQPFVPDSAKTDLSGAAPGVTIVTASAVLTADASLGEQFGLLDTLKDASTSLSTSLQQFVSKLSATLTQALDDMTTLEVATYVSSEMEQVKYENGRFAGANLRALVRIKLDGDTLLCVPEENGPINTEIWKMHLEMVQQAQASRAELLKTAVSAAAGLANLVKPGG
jgi:hypothetical protein